MSIQHTLKKFHQKRFYLLALLVVILVILGITVYEYFKETPQPHPSPTKVIVTQPQKRKVQPKLQVPGHLIAHNATWVTSHSTGFIKALLFHEGDYVHQDQPLILLDPTKIKAELESDATQLQTAQNKYNIEKHLRQKGFLSQPKLQQQQAKVAQSKATLLEDEADLKEMIIRAPFSGYLGAKQINVGDHINGSDKLVYLVDRQHLLVKYHIPANQVSHLKIGQTVSIKGDAKSFKGQISFIAPNIDTDSGTIEVHAQVNNTNNKLWPGEFVTVNQPTSQTQSRLLVPEQAVLSELGQHYVLLANDNKAKKQTVHLGQNYQGCVVITQGLKKDSQLIIAGQHQVHDKQPIKIAKHKQAQVCSS